MNILITGSLTSLCKSIIDISQKENHKVVLASLDSAEFSVLEKEGKVISHAIDPSNPLLADILSPYRFDAVVYLPLREEQLQKNPSNQPGGLLDGLRNTLDLCQHSGVKRFIYVSSTEVFGDAESREEDAQPQPTSLNGFVLLAGEQCCKYYHDNYQIDTHIIRVPLVYGVEEKNSFIVGLINACIHHKPVDLPGKKDTFYNLLHAEDVARFIFQVLDEPYAPDCMYLNLASSDQLKLSQIQSSFASHFPKISWSYNENKTLATQSAFVNRAKSVFDWLAVHDFKEELPQIIKYIQQTPFKKEKTFGKVRVKLTASAEALKWLELLGGAALMHFLNNLTGTLVQFRFVDFRLLYVVLLGSLHGIRFGLLAAVLASISILYSWYLSGLDWALLIYNVENWLPIAMYIIAGAATGYQRDKKENELAFQDKQFKLMEEKYGVLYGVYHDIARIKDQLREQILGYRDSFGRIFHITQELDTYHEDDVFFKALNILEEFLANQHIAIYTLNPNNHYARLAVSSQSLNHSLSKSLDLEQFPDIKKAIENRTIFQNTAMLAKYPAYVSPIFNDGMNVALIVIWEAGFDQFSMYYFNMVKIISGLIQSSLVRAALFQNASAEKMYLPSTRILTPQPFKEILDVKYKMRNNRIADFKLVRIEMDNKDWVNISKKAQKGIRATDYIGQLDDGNCYILLSQADSSNTNQIIQRLKNLGVKCFEIEENEVMHV